MDKVMTWEATPVAAEERFMSAHVAFMRAEDVRQDETAPQAPQELGPDALLPVIEGARARGVADAYELVGQAAILLDDAGGVLHVGTSAQRLLAEDINVRAGHLVGQTAAANQTIQRIIASALEDESSQTGEIERADGQAALKIRAFPFEKGVRSPFQMLAVVVLVDEA